MGNEFEEKARSCMRRWRRVALRTQALGVYSKLKPH